MKAGIQEQRAIIPLRKMNRLAMQKSDRCPDLLNIFNYSIVCFGYLSFLKRVIWLREMYMCSDSCRKGLLLSRIKKQALYYFALLAAVSVLLYSCASNPEQEPVVQEQSIDELDRLNNEPMNDEQSVDELERLRNLEEKAKGAIARAEAAGAAELSPVLLDEAYQNLRNGQEKNPKTDGEAQRDLYLASIEKADQAYDAAVKSSKSRWLALIDDYEADLDQLDAARYMPEYDARSRKLLQQLRDQIHEGDKDESLALYQSTIPNIEAVITALAANLDWLDQLRQEVTGLMGEASRNDLRGESAELENQGKDDYYSAMEHRARGDLQSMEQALYNARYYLREALRRSNALDPSGIDSLLRSVQHRLEMASRYKIIDEDGNLVEVEPWSGETYLQEHPLLDLSEQNKPGLRLRNESQLQVPQVSDDFFQEAIPVEAGSISEQSELQQVSFQAEWQLHAVTQLISESPDNNLNRENSREGNPFGEDRLQDEDKPEAPAREYLEPLPKTGRVGRQTKQPESVEEEPSAALTETDSVVSDDSQIGSAALLGDAQRLLKQAIGSWENGVVARNQGNLPKAQHYFEEAARLVDQYSIEYAILGYYTVRKLKPEDCLWCIAGYSDIYGDPFQWVRIYQRNRNIIDIPSLIYPGQRLVIPPPLER